jgi:hypothetical protein
MPETVVSETPMGSVEMPTEQPNAPVKTRLAFDWSNVKEESHRRPIPNVKSPWEKTDGIDENELYAEMTPSNDRSRTMNFIDVLKAEREEAARKKEEKPQERSFDYTQVLHLDLDNPETSEEEEQPKLSFAPLYEDTDSPVSTPFDGSESEESAQPDAQTHDKPAWKWFEMPDFLKPKVDDSVIARRQDTEETPENEASAETVSSEHALFEEPKYEEFTDLSEDTEDIEEIIIEETPESPETASEEVAYDEPEQEEPEVIETAETSEDADAGYDYSDYLDMDIDGYEEMSDTDTEHETEQEAPEENKHSNSRDLDDDLADILAAGDRTATHAKHAEPEPDNEEDEAEDEDAEEASDAVNEEELFAEMEESAPKKTGMTIAAPADKESEIEALKKRLAELMGTPVDTAETEAVPEPALAEAEPEEADELAPAEDVADSAGSGVVDEEPAATEAEPVTIEPIPEEPENEDVPQLTLEDLFADEADGAVYEPELIEIEPEAIEPEVAEISSGEIEKTLIAETDQGVSESDMPAKNASPAKPETDKFSSFEDELASFLADDPVIKATAGSDSDSLFNAADLHVEAVPASEPEPVEAEPAVMSIDELLAQQFGVAPAEPELLDKAPAHSAPPAELEPVVVQTETDSKPTDAMSLEDLESDLFGDSPSADAEAEVTKKIDKFYTLYRKNEEFQKLLDEEYNKLKTDTEPSEVQKEIAEAMGIVEEKHSRPVEDATIYQGLEEIREIEAMKAKQGQSEPKAAPVELPSDDRTAPKAATKEAPVELKDEDGAPAAGLSKKERKKAEKEQRRKEKEREKELKAASGEAAVDEDDYVEQGSTLLTIVAVIIAVLLVFLLAVILVLNFAPNSGIALQIDSVIENITSHFSAVDSIGGGYLL